MAEQQSFLSSWQERLTALRNTPPVLKIVWKSGPGVVVFGLVSRLFASLLPLALLWIPKLIVDEIVHPQFTGHVMSPGCGGWWRANSVSPSWAAFSPAPSIIRTRCWRTNTPATSAFR